VDVRLLGPDDLDEYFAVRVQAFGMTGTDTDRVLWRAFIAAADPAPIFGAYDGRLLGALRVLPAGQHLAGRRVGMGGVAGVVVRPETRGRGVARTLLEESLRWMRDEGLAVSSLHPASTRVYRSMGWEIAGDAGHVAVPSRSLAGIRGDETGTVVALGPADMAACERLYAAWAPAVHGTLDRTGAFWAMHRVWEASDGAFAYGVRRGDELAGFVRYQQLPRQEWGYGIRIEDFVAPDAAVATALWHFLGAHAMQVERVEVPIVALPELLLLLDEQDDTPVRANRWMHRIVDVARFMGERGFGLGSHTAVVRLTDPWPDGVVGAWRLECADGTGTATAATEAEATVTADVGAFSALTIGGFTAGDLVAAGRLRGDPAAIASLAAMFAAPPPRISDDF
jgi:predicted acetyltransferase